jgi:excisionase family DNA binding protein
MKREFTVGQIAKILNVARSTVIYWIKDGRIKAYQTPGGNNRVTRENLSSFMYKYDIPIEYLNDFTRRRILIVSSDGPFRRELAARFEGSGDFDVYTCTSWFEAGMHTREASPNGIIVDIHTEDQGIEVCDALKKVPELKKTRVFAVSGIFSLKKKKAREHGFRDFFTKPVDTERCCSAVTRILS